MDCSVRDDDAGEHRAEHAGVDDGGCASGDGGSDRDEGEFARQAAKTIGTTHHDLKVTQETLWDNLKECLWFSELPLL